MAATAGGMESAQQASVRLGSRALEWDGAVKMLQYSLLGSGVCV